MTSQGERFRRRALRRGYKVDEVDAFLDRVEATLEGQPIGPPVASQEVDDVVFRVRFGGYDEWQVDVYLDRVARQLSELEERGVLGRAAAPDFEGRPSRASMEGPGGRGPRDPREMHAPAPGRDPREHRDPRDLHEPRDPRDPRDLHDPRDPRDPRDRDRDMHHTPPRGMDPRDPRGMDPRGPAPMDPRMPSPADARGGPPPPDPRDMPEPRGRQPEQRPARGAAPAGRDRFGPPPPPPAAAPPPPSAPDHQDGFGHLAGGDDEGFGHLAPRSDDFDDRPARSARSRGGGLYSGLSDLSGDGAPPPPPSPVSGPPQSEDRYGAPPPPPPPPSRFDRAADDRYGPPPAAPPPPPEPTTRFAAPDDRYGPPPGERPPAPADRFAPPPDDRFAPPPPMPPRGPEPDRGYGGDRMPPPPPPSRDERRPASPVDRFAPPPGGPDATQIQSAVPPPMPPPPAAPQRPGTPPGRPPYGGDDPYSRGGGFTEPGRHGRPEMTTEMRAPDSPFTGDDISRLEQIRRSFQPRRFGSGYDPSQVDRLFDAVSATMTGRAAVPLSDAELDTSQFSLVQGGYFEAEVDAALREIRDTFARRGLMRLDPYGRRGEGRYR